MLSACIMKYAWRWRAWKRKGKKAESITITVITVIKWKGVLPFIYYITN